MAMRLFWERGFKFLVFLINLCTSSERERFEEVSFCTILNDLQLQIIHVLKQFILGWLILIPFSTLLLSHGYMTCFSAGDPEEAMICKKLSNNNHEECRKIKIILFQGYYLDSWLVFVIWFWELRFHSTGTSPCLLECWHVWLSNITLVDLLNSYAAPALCQTLPSAFYT